MAWRAKYTTATMMMMMMMMIQEKISTGHVYSLREKMPPWSKPLTAPKGFPLTGRNGMTIISNLLGHALAGNTHLRLLLLKDASSLANYDIQRGSRALCHGIGQSQLECLVAIDISLPLQQSLFHQIRTCSTLQGLEILRTTLDIPRLTSSPNQFLKTLRLSSCDLDDVDIQVLSRGLWASIPALSSLNLSHNVISDAGAESFCQYWSGTSLLQDLDLESNYIGSDGAILLLQETVGRSSFCTLDLSRNFGIAEDGLGQIGDLLPKVSFSHLHIGECCWPQTVPPDPFAQTTDTTRRALANGLRHNTSLLTLYVGGNDLGPSGAQMLMQAAAVHPSLEKLSLSNDVSIGLNGIKLIGKELASTKLKELMLVEVLPDNWPNPQSQAALAAGQALLDGVRRNGNLTHLCCAELPKVWNDPIQFFTNWNQTCRPLLCCDAVAPSVWPYVLSHFQRDDQLSNLYFSLRGQPWLVASAATIPTAVTQPRNVSWESLAGWVRHLPDLLVSQSWKHLFQKKRPNHRKRQRTETTQETSQCVPAAAAIVR
jgi:hypothetical protein